MGNTCMGKPRPRDQFMLKKDEPSKRYADYDTKKTKNSETVAVVGESEGNRLKINKSLLSCSVCMQNYNLTNREPLMVCGNNHTYCRECVQSTSHYNNRCPECRGDLRDPMRNRDIYQLVQDNQQALREGKLQQAKDQGQNQFVDISINRNNQFIQNFWIQKTKVMKIDDDGVWEGLTSVQVLPRDKQICYSVKIVHSKFNNIQLGIVGKGYKIQKNITCIQSVMYHLADGKILEGVRGRKSEWKGRGQAVPIGKVVTIKVSVNGPLGKVSWWGDGLLLGEGKFSDFLLQHEYTAYILMSHKEDIIQLNA